MDNSQFYQVIQNSTEEMNLKTNKDPFKFLELPKELQNYTLSFIPALETRKMLQVSKSIADIANEHFNQFEVGSGVRPGILEFTTLINSLKIAELQA